MSTVAIPNIKGITYKLRDHGFSCMNFHSNRCTHVIVNLRSKNYRFSSQILGIQLLPFPPESIGKIVFLHSLGLTPKEIKETIES